MIITSKYKAIELILLITLCLLAGIFSAGCATDTKPPLHKYIEEGDTERAKELIYRRAYINAIDRDTNMTPLMTALNNNQLEIAKLLIEIGADINEKDHYGWTALMFALNNDQTEIAKIIIEKGADINAKNRYGWSLLHIAAYNDNQKIVEYLIEAGAEVKEVEGNVKKERAMIVAGKATYVTDEDTYANAQLYRYAARYDQKNGNLKAAIEHYKIAATYYREASILFKERAGDYSSTKELIDDLSYAVYSNPLLGPLFRIPAGFITSHNSRNKDNASILKRIYAKKYKKSNRSYLECDKIIKCYENSDQENAVKCFKK